MIKFFFAFVLAWLSLTCQAASVPSVQYQYKPGQGFVSNSGAANGPMNNATNTGNGGVVVNMPGVVRTNTPAGAVVTNAAVTVGAGAIVGGITAAVAGVATAPAIAAGAASALIGWGVISGLQWAAGKLMGPPDPPPNVVSPGGTAPGNLGSCWRASTSYPCSGSASDGAAYYFLQAKPNPPWTYSLSGCNASSSTQALCTITSVKYNGVAQPDSAVTVKIDNTALCADGYSKLNGVCTSTVSVAWTNAQLTNALNQALAQNPSKANSLWNSLDPNLQQGIVGNSAPGTVTVNQTGQATAPTPSSTTTNPDGSTSTTTGSSTTTVTTVDNSVQSHTVNLQNTTNYTTVNNSNGQASTTSTSTTDPNAQAKPDPVKTDCELFPNASACQELDTPVDDGDILKKDVSVSFSPVSIGSSGSCPAPRSVSLSHLGQSASFSYTPICDLAGYIRPLVIALGWLAAGFIMFGRPQES